MKEKLNTLIMKTLEFCDQFEMVNEEERDALADILTVEILGHFDLIEKLHKKSGVEIFGSMINRNHGRDNKDWYEF